MKNNRKKGFTLVEILIALLIIGVLVAVMIANMAKLKPDKRKALFIKAYTVTEQATANMVNDSEMYPTIFDEDGDVVSYGLSSTSEPVGILLQTDNVPSGADKFVHYFSREVGGSYSNNKVETSDGVIFDIERENTNAKTIDALAFTITISMIEKKNNAEVKQALGVINVRNGGAVECGDTACTTYMEDRYNLRRSN